MATGTLTGEIHSRHDHVRSPTWFSVLFVAQQNRGLNLTGLLLSRSGSILTRNSSAQAGGSSNVHSFVGIYVGAIGYVHGRFRRFCVVSTQQFRLPMSQNRPSGGLAFMGLPCMLPFPRSPIEGTATIHPVSYESVQTFRGLT